MQITQLKIQKMNINSKLPNVGTTIFTVMSRLANESGAINLSQGFPNFDCSIKLQNAAEKYLKSGYNQYAPMAGVQRLRENIAKKIDIMYGTSVNSETEITVTAGATQAIYTVISAFIHPGDEVILIEPAYDSYRPSVEVNGGIAVAYNLTAPDYKIDWSKMQNLVTDKTKMIIINTPHNPTGTTLNAADMQALEKLTERTDILVLSDEVYEHLVYDGAEHPSVLRYPNLFKRSLATYSFGKTLHATGWKLGYVIAPENLMVEFRKVHQFNVFCVNTPMQNAIADFLEDPEEYLSLPNFYQQKRDFFASEMQGSSLQPIPCTGTYFQMFDYSAISQEKDTDFAKRMTTEFGVAAIPVSVFYANGHDDKVIRLCFAKTEETLAAAGKLLRGI